MNLEALDNRELRLLVDAAVTVLADELGEDESDRLRDLPADRAEAELATLLSEEGVERADASASRLTDPEGQVIAKEVLAHLLTAPDTSEQIEATYDDRRSMMALDAGLITGPVLLAIVLLRLKRIKIGKAVDIQFADTTGVTKLLDLLTGGRGGS